MTATGTAAGLARGVRSGDVSAIARMITAAERGIILEEAGMTPRDDVE
jgi:hypothetical protein